MKKIRSSDARFFSGHNAGAVIVLAAAIFSVIVVALNNGRAESGQAQAERLSSSATIVFEETFESALGPEWTVSDVDGVVNGEYYWARTDQAASEGSFSAWATGGGADGGSLQPGVDDYPNSAGSLMIRDAVDLSDQTGALLTFDVWHKTQPTFDVLEVAVSTDGAAYNQLAVYSGDSSGWLSKEVDMSAYAGQASVYVRFYFSSNAATTDEGVYLDNIRLEGLSNLSVYFPILRLDPTPTPTPTPTPPPFFYFDDYSNPASGWPVVDNTHNSQDCYKWYYNGSTQTYRNDICDDRTDVKVSPGVDLPAGDYVVEVDGRFRLQSNMWWTAYGVLFDAKDDPNPSKPDLGDYYMLWILWEGNGKHKWKILKDVPGSQKDVTSWKILDSSYYDYGNGGTNFNSWRIERTSNSIRVLVNDHQLANISEPRPTSNNQVLFGLYSSTYETSVMQAGFDNYLVDTLGTDTSADAPYWSPSDAEGIVVSGQFDLEHALPNGGVHPPDRQ